MCEAQLCYTENGIQVNSSSFTNEERAKLLKWKQRDGRHVLGALAGHHSFENEHRYKTADHDQQRRP